jgi:hypothetical protein
MPLPGGRTLIVSRGVGATESPIRWNADADVLVIDVGSRDPRAPNPSRRQSRS